MALQQLTTSMLIQTHSDNHMNLVWSLDGRHHVTQVVGEEGDGAEVAGLATLSDFPNTEFI